MVDVVERCPDCGVVLQHPGTDKWMPIEEGTTAHTKERCLEHQLTAARAEAERYREQYEALESFVLAEKAVREHAEICVWWGWKPGACPNGVCRRVEARRDEAYMRAMTAMGLTEGYGANDA